MTIDEIEIGDNLREKAKWLEEREKFYVEKGFYKKKGKDAYVFYENVKFYVTNKTVSSVEVFIGKKTNHGVNCKNWFSLKNFNDRFEKL